MQGIRGGQGRSRQSVEADAVGFTIVLLICLALLFLMSFLG